MTKTMIDSVRLKAHAHQNISLVLDALNIAYCQRGQLYQARCPIKDHPGNGDNDKAFSWKEGVNNWACWSHACDEKYGGDVYGLIRGVLQVSFRDAVDFLFKTLTERCVNLAKDVGHSTQKTKGPKLNKPIAESSLKYLQHKYGYPLDKSLIERGFKPEYLKRAGIGFWHQLGTFMNDRMVFPIRDHAGFLIGFSGRTIYAKENWVKNGVEQKWLHGKHFMHWPRKNDELATSSVLYNFHSAKSHTGDSKTIILVEGILDALKLDQSGVHNVCAILGTANFSNFHRSLLIDNGINRVVLAMDTDVAGQAANKRIAAKLSDYFHVSTPLLPKKDPGDMLEDEIRAIFI